MFLNNLESRAVSLSDELVDVTVEILVLFVRLWLPERTEHAVDTRWN